MDFVVFTFRLFNRIDVNLKSRNVYTLLLKIALITS